MIVVLGIEFSINKIRKILGDNYKGYNIKYCSFKTIDDLADIVADFDSEVDGILGNSILVYLRLKEIGYKHSIPYQYIHYDSSLILSYVLNILIDNPHIAINKLYIDLFQVFMFESKALYYLFPEKFRNQIKFFDFKGDVSVHYDKVFEDIKIRYENGEIDFACVWHAGYEEKLQELGIEYLIYDEMYFNQVKESFNKLLIKIDKDIENESKKYTMAVQFSKEHQHAIKQLIAMQDFKNITEDDEYIYGNVNSSNIYYSDENLFCEFCFSLLNIDDKCIIGIGEGFNDSQSKLNASEALKYSRAFGQGNCFLFTNQRNIIGPANSDFCLSLSEYELKRLEKSAKNLGIKAFNLSRLLVLFEKQKWLKNSDVSSYLNIALKSSSRILNTLLEHGIVECVKSRSNKAGRPELLYSIIDKI